MKTVRLSTHLDAHPDQVWNELIKPRLLQFVAHPILQFTPISPEKFPERWAEGDYVLRMRWSGIVPLGEHVIKISMPTESHGIRTARDNGHGTLAKRWDHLITVEPEGDGTRYTDQVDIDAGIMTPLVVAFARRFYLHRQKRWHQLVSCEFDYTKAE